MRRSIMGHKLLILLLVLSIGVMTAYGVLRKNPVGAGVRFVPDGGLPAGYVWNHVQGADFDTYYAQDPDGQDAGIGIYLGDHPNFPYTKNLPCENDRILGTKVCWVVLDGLKETRYYRTTFLRYKYGIYRPVYIHIWVYADNREKLQLMLRALRHLRVRPEVSIFQLFIRNILNKN